MRAFLHSFPLPALLLTLVLPAQDARDAAAAKPDYTVLEQEFEQAQRAWTQRRQGAPPDAPREPHPQQTFLDRFAAGAAAHAGTPQAVPFLVWIARSGPAAAAREAMTTLLDDHVADPGIRLAVARIGGRHHEWGAAQSRTWLDRVLELNQDRGVRAQARFTRAAMYLGTRAVHRGEAERALALADLRDVLHEPQLPPGLHGLAVDLLYEAALLDPGMPAPEIAGADLDGVPFELSDYRGKVVLLDFWGDW